MLYFKSFIACFIGCILILPAKAQVWEKRMAERQQSSNYALTKYTIADGLPSKNATITIKDRRGFIWVGTEGGLCKFDGYTFKVFANHKGDSTSLSNNFINALIEDKSGRIWVGTMDGLNLFDPNTEKFTRFYDKEKDTRSLSNNRVWSLLADSHIYLKPICLTLPICLP